MSESQKPLPDYLLEAADPSVFTEAQWRTLVTLRHELSCSIEGVREGAKEGVFLGGVLIDKGLVTAREIKEMRNTVETALQIKEVFENPRPQEGEASSGQDSSNQH